MAHPTPYFTFTFTYTSDLISPLFSFNFNDLKPTQGTLNLFSEPGSAPRLRGRMDAASILVDPDRRANVLL